MNLIVGLGNPGEKYQKNRHNVGFILLDSLDLNWEKDKYGESFFAKSSIGGEDFVFIKPETYMNESGRAVLYYKNKFGINNENIFVIYDDIDLPFGDIRISFDRGSGGHNGIKSITESISGNDYLRLRFGIAPKDEEGRAIKPKGGFFTPASKAVSNFVLKDFSASDLEKVKSFSGKFLEILKTLAKEGRGAVMNRFN